MNDDAWPINKVNCVVSGYYSQYTKRNGGNDNSNTFLNKGNLFMTYITTTQNLGRLYVLM